MAYAKAIAASLVNINVSSPGPSIDGVMLNIGDRVLLTRQTTPSQNGVWIFDTDVTAMDRPGAPDQYQSGVSFDNATVLWVTGGDTLAGTVWGIEPATRVTVGTTAHNLTRVSLPPVQCRVATTENITIGGTHLIIDGTSVADGEMTAGGMDPDKLTCATSNPFTLADVGKRIRVAGAGSMGVDLVTTIAAVNSTFGECQSSCRFVDAL